MARRENQKPKEPKVPALSPAKRKDQLQADVRAKFQAAFKHELSVLLYPPPKK